MTPWITQQQAAIGLALHRLHSTPLNTLLAALAIGIALALPAGGHMLLASLQQLGQGSNATPQLSVFMALDADRKASTDVGNRLRSNASIKEVRTITKEETLKRMRSNEGLSEVIDALPQNPFPDAFVVTPRDETPAAMEQLKDELRRLPKVEFVQLDAAWAKRLSALLQVAKVSVLLLASLFGVGLVALIFNTIRLQILTQKAEIEVCRLLGATDGFIGRPFHYFGAIQGLLGGLTAWLVVMGATLLLRAPVSDLSALYNLEFTLKPLAGLESLAMLGIASSLGWIGAALSVRQYLRTS